MVELAENDLGGCKLASAAISGSGAVYGQLKFESGIHRVQRVPVTESGACWRAGVLACWRRGCKRGSSCGTCMGCSRPWGCAGLADRALHQTDSELLGPFIPSLALCRRARAHQRGLGGGAASG